MALNRLKSLWKAGKPALGVIVTMPSVQTMQVLAHAGFDWLAIDMEHGPIDLPSAHAMIVATAGTPTVPIARVAANTAWLAKPLLDAGVLGLCMPLVETRADAEKTVGAVRYPPRGARMWGPFYAPLRWDLPMPAYMREADDEVLAIATIETIAGVRNAEDIASVPGLDLAIIGPGDLATNLGHYGQVDHPDVQSAIRVAESAFLGSDVALGGVAFSPDQANRMIDAGYRVIALGFDWLLLQKAAAAVLHGIKR